MPFLDVCTAMGWKKLVVLSVLLVSGGIVASAQVNVEVVVTDVRDTAGTVMVALFSDPADFLKKPLIGKMAKPARGQVTVVFENLKPGDYAASIIHDANGNRKLDTNFMGMPKEGFGFSNNVMGTFGPPSFDKAKFTVREPVVIRIKTKYL